MKEERRQTFQHSRFLLSLVCHTHLVLTFPDFPKNSLPRRYLGAREQLQITYIGYMLYLYMHVYLIPEDVFRIFYDFWCNWRSLKPFLSRVILTHKDDDDDYGQVTVWERKLRAFLVSYSKRSSDLNKT